MGSTDTNPRPIHSANASADVAPCSKSTRCPVRHVWRTIGWFACGAPISLAVAWIAFQLQQEGIAPAVLFPLAVGAAVAGGLVVAARLLGLPLRKSALIAALVWSLATVAGQEWFAYVRYCRVYEEAVHANPRAAFAATAAPDWGPTQFGDFVRARISRDRAWWLLDAGLTAAGAVATVMWARRVEANHHCQGKP